MFRVAFLCQDKQLPSILRDLGNRVFDLEVQPVTVENGAAPQPTTKKKKSANGGAAPPDTAEQLLARLPEAFSHDDIQSALVALGRGAYAGHYWLTKLTKMKRYKTYSFRTRDPIIDAVRNRIDGHKVAEISRDSGVSSSTIFKNGRNSLQ